MAPDIMARRVLYIVSAYPKIACVSLAHDPTALGIGCLLRAREPDIANSGFGQGCTTVHDPRNYAKNIAVKICQEPRSACVGRVLPIRTMHS